MSKVVFILGAGASRHCGGPLMGEFLDVARDLLLTNRVEDCKEDFQRVFAAIGNLQAVHSKAQFDLNNIESIFTALELGRIIQSFPGLSKEDIDKTIASLKRLIVKTLEVRISFPFASGIKSHDPYRKFADLLTHLRTKAVPSQSVSVITFNYDVAVDLALHQAGHGPDYVLESSRAGRGQVQLMKLHGSLNWAIDQDTDEIKPVYLDQFFGEYRIDKYRAANLVHLPIGSLLVEYFQRFRNGTKVKPEPVIVPPSWNKADYQQALSNVWAAAASNLEEAEYIFIIGFSLPDTDSFFRHLYALGSIGKVPLRKIVVCNPDPSEETDRRFRTLLGSGALARYEYIRGYFEDMSGWVRNIFPERN